MSVSRLSLLTVLALAGCPSEGDKPASHDTGADDTAPPTETDTSEPVTHTITATVSLSAGWASGSPLYAGYAMVADASGIYIDQPLGDGVTAYDYRIPYDAGQGVVIEEVADLTLDVGPTYGTDKFSLLPDGRISIPNNYATGDADASGIAYVVDEAALVSGYLPDQAALTIYGGIEVGYTGFVLPLDADGDGTADDIVVSGSTDNAPGHLAIFLDAPTTGAMHWADADYTITTCEPSTEPEEALIGMCSVALSDGYLIAGCCSTDYSDGAADRYALPLSASSAPVDRVQQLSGWRVSPSPAGGFYDEAQGRGAAVYVSPEGTRTDISPVGAAAPWGSSPVVGEVGGRLLLAIGDPGYESAALDGSGSGKVGGVYVCDVTEDPIPDLDACLVLDGPSDVGTNFIGAVLAWADTDGDGSDDTLVASGWQYGTAKGGGIAAWTVSAE